MPEQLTRLSCLPKQVGLGFLWIAGLVSVVVAGGCGGGGKGDSGDGVKVNQAPTITSLTLTPTGRFLGRRRRTTVKVDTELFRSRGRHEHPCPSVRWIESDATCGEPAARKQRAIRGEIDLSIQVAGGYTAEVWVVDRVGNSSNRLTAPLTVEGSAALSALTLSGGLLIRPSPQTTEYTAGSRLRSDFDNRQGNAC